MFWITLGGDKGKGTSLHLTVDVNEPYFKSWSVHESLSLKLFLCYMLKKNKPNFVIKNIFNPSIFLKCCNTVLYL